MGESKKAQIIDFCAYQAKAEVQLDGRAEATVRDFYRAFEQELALGSRFFLVAPDGVHMTELFDPRAITFIYIRTSARPDAGKLAIMPAPERAHIFEAVEESPMI
jgi:hypothetical protein